MPLGDSISTATDHGFIDSDNCSVPLLKLTIYSQPTMSYTPGNRQFAKRMVSTDCFPDKLAAWWTSDWLRSTSGSFDDAKLRVGTGNFVNMIRTESDVSTGASDILWVACLALAACATSERKAWLYSWWTTIVPVFHQKLDKNDLHRFPL